MKVREARILNAWLSLADVTKHAEELALICIKSPKNVNILESFGQLQGLVTKTLAVAPHPSDDKEFNINQGFIPGRPWNAYDTDNAEAIKYRWNKAKRTILGA